MQKKPLECKKIKLHEEEEDEEKRVMMSTKLVPSAHSPSLVSIELNLIKFCVAMRWRESRLWILSRALLSTRVEMKI